MKAYYTPRGRKWFVVCNGQTEEFVNLEAMLEKHPEWMELKPIDIAFQRRQRAQNPSSKIEIEPIEIEVDYKTESCYYCEGTGELMRGIPCDNCKGEGQIELSTRGL